MARPPAAARICRTLAAALALLIAAAMPAPSRADDHHHDRHGGFHGDHDHDRWWGPRYGFGLYLGPPAVYAPPPVIYPYPYPAPGVVPVSPAYRTVDGRLCRDYRTPAGYETACLYPDGVWRFVN